MKSYYLVHPLASLYKTGVMNVYITANKEFKTDIKRAALFTDKKSAKAFLNSIKRDFDKSKFVVQENLTNCDKS